MGLHDRVFEFTHGVRRFAVTREPGGVVLEHAAALLRRCSGRDLLFRRRLAAWYRRTTFTSGLADDERVLGALLVDVSAGRLRVHDLGPVAVPSYAHTVETTEPRTSPPTSALNEFESGLDEPTLAELRTVEYLAVGDFNFSTDRAVMLPGPSSEAELEGDAADGIALIAGLLAHLRRTDAERRVMAAGHTDAAGSFAHNLELSEHRARSVKLACDGDAEGFADHAVAHAQVADGQEVLRWIDRRFGWACDPGVVDNDDGPKTSGARARFRERFELELGGTAGSGPAFERLDWVAFFRLYEQDLAARLGVTVGGLPSLRARLSWAEPAIIGCGEHWPEDSVNRSPVNYADRRVELLCFLPEHLPGGAGSPPGASVYADPRYRWSAIRPGPGPHPLGGPCFELSLVAEDFDGLGEGAVLRLRGGPYDLRHSLSDAQASGGFLTFHFHGVARHVTYLATIEREGTDPVVLFEGASLDSFIDGIDDLDLQPELIFVRSFRGSDSRGPGGVYEYVEPPED